MKRAVAVSCWMSIGLGLVLAFSPGCSASEQSGSVAKAGGPLEGFSGRGRSRVINPHDLPPEKRATWMARGKLREEIIRGDWHNAKATYARLLASGYTINVVEALLLVRMAQATGDEALEFQALQVIVHPPEGSGTSLSTESSYVRRYHELAPKHAANMPSVDVPLDFSKFFVKLPNFKYRVTLSELIDLGWTEKDALDLYAIRGYLDSERDHEAEELAVALIARNRSALAYAMRFSTAIRVAPPKDTSALYYAKVAYVQADPELRSAIAERFGAHVVKDWPQSPEELEHP